MTNLIKDAHMDAHTRNSAFITSISLALLWISRDRFGQLHPLNRNPRADCPRGRDEFFKNCKCSKHLRWSSDGKQYRHSAKTRTWSIAEQRRRVIEARFAGSDPAKPLEAVKLEAMSAPTIERAVELFLSDKRSQGLDTAVLKKYIRWGDSASSWRSGLGISLVRSASKISRSFAQRGELPTPPRRHGQRSRNACGHSSVTVTSQN